MPKPIPKVSLPLQKTDNKYSAGYKKLNIVEAPSGKKQQKTPQVTMLL
jgi:hypothetical protein